MATTPVVIDFDLDGYDDILYIADLTGDLWRFDLSTSPWTKTKLYDGNQPIQAQPILTVNEKGDILLYFGTGKYIEASDISNTDLQTFYCIIDNHSGETVTRSGLVDQTYSITTVGPTADGWYLDLVQSAGERITRPDALAAGTVYFTSYAPTDETCRAGGSAWFYQVDFLDGTNPDNDDGTEDDGTDKRVVALGDGINSEPIIDMVNEDVITQSTDTGIDTRDTKGTILRILVRSWRQAWD